MLGIAFAGTFSARLEEPVRAHLDMPWEVVVADEAGIVSKLPDVDVLITLAFSREMGAAARRLNVSGWTDGMLEARAKLIAENIRRTARGELPLSLIAA
jgi:hypothetical protein